MIDGEHRVACLEREVQRLADLVAGLDDTRKRMEQNEDRLFDRVAVLEAKVAEQAAELVNVAANLDGQLGAAGNATIGLASLSHRIRRLEMGSGGELP